MMLICDCQIQGYSASNLVLIAEIFIFSLIINKFILNSNMIF